MTGYFSTMLRRIIQGQGGSQAAKTVEVFGWLILAESPVILFAPHFVAAVLRMPELSEQAANFFRVIGLLVGGLGMLYVLSGRLNAQGFVFASLLDRPLVPPIMALLWWLGIVPGGLALIFAVQDFGSFLWTLRAWKAEARGEE